MRRNTSLVEEQRPAGQCWSFLEEIDVESLAEMSTERRELRTNIEGFHLSNGNWLNLLGGGNIVNIACGDGHPAEIMDTSFAFAGSFRTLCGAAGE